MEVEIVLGGLYRKAGTPKKGGTLASPQRSLRKEENPEISLASKEEVNKELMLSRWRVLSGMNKQPKE